ncbi:hypothetical protein [Nonomuraea guangzhouensis]|uniref:Uncharacterized protein n=1 Tax=Nonomuraea guangzhouensis TaxID=1291555 RepID=A0ABW4GH06_9ACTN|nr:hypothetical protein [Nonomuraea guangzhouensis]
MKHNVSGQTTDNPHPAHSLKFRKILWRAYALLASARRVVVFLLPGTLTALLTAVPVVALMAVGYQIGGVPVMWGTLIGTVFPLLRGIGDWRRDRRARDRRDESA